VSRVLISSLSGLLSAEIVAQVAPDQPTLDKVADRAWERMWGPLLKVYTEPGTDEDLEADYPDTFALFTSILVFYLYLTRPETLILPGVPKHPVEREYERALERLADIVKGEDALPDLSPAAASDDATPGVDDEDSLFQANAPVFTGKTFRGF